MVKAEIKKKDGTHIVIDGSEEEVKRLLDSIHEDKSAKILKAVNNRKTKTKKLSIGDMILELREEGFFDKPKSLVEIKNALAERGGIYEVTTLSAQVVRQIRKRSLGRIKQEKKWMYVKR